MKKYKHILVLENDSKGVPSYLSNVLARETVSIEYWYDFKMSFHWDKAKAFGRLNAVSDDTLLVCAPSFAGPDNSFEGYLMVFLQLKDMGKRVDIAVMYPDNFYIYLLKFLADPHTNALKRKNNLDMLKEILSFHNLYEISSSVKSEEGLDNTKHITFESLMENYLETNQKLGRTLCEVKDTGEVYECYSVYYKTALEESEVVLYIESNPNNRYKFNQIRKK